MAVPGSPEDRSARLELGLQDGFTRIGEAMSKGVAVENWEAHWLLILREYESLEDEIAAHHAAPQPAVQVGMSGMPRREVA